MEKRDFKTQKRKQWISGAAGMAVCFLALTGVLYAYAAPQDYEAQGPIAQSFTILESEGGTYFGPVAELLYTGEGEFQHLDGSVYQGSFQNSRRSGEGTFYWANGDRYTGTWENDQMKNGMYRFADGRSYEGTFADNRFSSGVYRNGDTASVTYAYGVITGISLQTADGVAYDGELSGWAVIHYADGSTYDGQVKNGSRNGNGTYRWKSGETVTAYYEGQWVNGQMSGQGTYHYSGGEYPCLKGTFANGKPDGTAVYHKESGNTFDTTWRNGTCSNVTET